MAYSPNSQAHRVPGGAVEIGGAGGSLQGRYPLANQADRHARQHVSAAADGHAGVAGGIFKDPAAVRNDGPGTFQHQNAAVFFGECLRLPDPGPLGNSP